MGRAKIEIKYIENTPNRQATYSKRRSGIMKKAHELTVRCDAQICVTMFSSTGKLHEYVSPSTTLKEFVDRYQRETCRDLWEAEHEALEEELIMQQEIGSRLKKEIRQRTGQDDLSELSIEELGGLEKDLAGSLKILRERKEHVLTSRTNIFGRKVRCLEEARKRLLRSVHAKKVEPYYPVPAENEGDHYPEYAQKQEQQFFSAVPANKERDQQPNYGAASSSVRREFINDRGGDCESSEITFQQLQPSHTNLNDEAGGACQSSYMIRQTDGLVTISNMDHLPGYGSGENSITLDLDITGNLYLVGADHVNHDGLDISVKIVCLIFVSALIWPVCPIIWARHGESSSRSKAEKEGTRDGEAEKETTTDADLELEEKLV
ncbi:floral homeotic protein FBP1-like [Papaver somniferum]|uniref:floral homeotic protein FBP1-like n=1 Tax=Papaver somniferum TaxID=3469 RepID=UPI000E6FB1E0|nr:floral homeotic protein FBP1-like [Papaver somniferum]